MIETADAAANAASAGFVWVSDDERRYLESTLSVARRQQYISGHWFARVVLADFTGIPAMNWRLSRAPQGGLCAGSGSGRIYVSLSHSGRWVSAAVSTAPVGVDVETASRPRDYPGMSHLCCTPDERACLNRLDTNDLTREFLRLWTLKEAWAKREGRGFDLARFRQISFLPGHLGHPDALSWHRNGVTLAVASQPGAQIQLSVAYGDVQEWCICDDAAGDDRKLP